MGEDSSLDVALTFVTTDRYFTRSSLNTQGVDLIIKEETSTASATC